MWKGGGSVVEEDRGAARVGAVQWGVGVVAGAGGENAHVPTLGEDLLLDLAGERDGHFLTQHHLSV